MPGAQTTLVNVLAAHQSDGYDYCRCGWRCQEWDDGSPSWNVQQAEHQMARIHAAGLTVTAT